MDTYFRLWILHCDELHSFKVGVKLADDCQLLAEEVPYKKKRQDNE